jgi:chromosome segregation ATPase
MFNNVQRNLSRTDMARIGISKQAVFAAANQLISQCKEPTIEQIRLILKTGSNSTIAGHLRHWRALQTENETQTLTDGLPHEIVLQVRQLWDRLTAHARIDVEEAKAENQQALTELQQELEKYQANNRRWQRLFTDWQAEKEKWIATNTELMQTIHALEIKVEVLNEQLKEKRLRVEELHRLHRQAQENLELYREIAKA